MYSIGIDSGSVATKAVLFKDGIVDTVLIPTGWSPKNACNDVFESLLARNSLNADEVYVVATGYGRVATDFADKTLTEITCHGKGAHYLDSDVRTILDIGGQDSKVIKLDRDGNIADFIMNDKCAAGTGRFLQVMVSLLGADIEDLDSLTRGAEPEKINSMCTVFAESEVVSMLAGGSSVEAVASGILHSIAGKISTLASRVGIENKVMFTGGLAKSSELTRIIEQKLGREVVTNSYSQLNGAIGAAVLGQHFANKKSK